MTKLEKLYTVAMAVMIIAMLILNVLLAIAVSYCVDRMGSTGVELGSQAATKFTDVMVTGTLTAGTLNGTGALTVGGDITVGDDLAVTGDMAAAEDATVGDAFIITAQTAISVTDGSVITATGSYQPLTSADEVTATIETAGFITGTELILINTTDTTINIADTGTAKLTAAAALGQYDLLSLIFDGTNWIETGRNDN